MAGTRQLKASIFATVKAPSNIRVLGKDKHSQQIQWKVVGEGDSLSFWKETYRLDGEWAVVEKAWEVGEAGVL